MQDRLSSSCSFIIAAGEVNEDGYIILYASPGFVELFEYPAGECVGKRCRPFRCCSPPSCITIAATQGVDVTVVQDASSFLDEYVKSQIGVALGSAGQPGSNIAFSLFLNCKKGGAAMVCDLILTIHKEPNTGWPYVVCLQRDITSEVSIKWLLAAVALGGDYSDLVRDQEEKMRATMKVTGVDCGETMLYFHEKAMWSWMAKYNMSSRGLKDGSTSAATVSEATEESVRSGCGF